MFKFNFPKFNFKENRTEPVDEPILEASSSIESLGFDETIKSLIKNEATHKVSGAICAQVVDSWYESQGVTEGEIKKAIDASYASKQHLYPKCVGHTPYYTQDRIDPKYKRFVEENQSSNGTYTYRLRNVGEAVTEMVREYAESIVQEYYDAQ